MVCTANDLSAWKDFPKGLKVLLLDEDSSSAAEIKSKLESMDYVVFTFCDEKEALSAISEKPESFHVAIVEVSTNNSSGCFKFLENAKDLPTIMTSNIHCLSTMMKCIALGAVEFLRKPVSEDKLRNIWQHVVHKAFNAGGNALSESLKPIKDSVISMLQIKVETEQIKEENLQEETQNMCSMYENELELSPASDKYPAPLTPQLNQGGRILDDADCQENNNSTEKDCGEQDGESKSVETTSGMDEVTLVENCPERRGGDVIKMEDDSTVHVNSDNNECLKHENAVSPHPQSKDHMNNSNDVGEMPNKSCTLQDSCGTKASRKKMKVDWTPDLHKKFVQAVEQLGVDQAIPSRILELMKVEGLTRHNVASHLQKYRMHRRHILPKDDDWRLAQQRDQAYRSYYQHKPIIAYPPYHSNHTVPYPIWGASGGQPAGVHMWASPGYPQWPAADGWHWKPYAGIHADAWGCPVMPPPYNTCSSSPPNASGIHSPLMVENTCSVPQKSIDLYPAEEIIDKAVKEAISKPWMPLPLGLKPPSTEIVLAELSRQGISAIPSQVSPSNSF